MHFQPLVRVSILIAFFAAVGCSEPGNTQKLEGLRSAETELPRQEIAPPVSSHLNSSRPASFRSSSAKKFLEDVFAGYRTAKAYHDRGRVRLKTTENGKEIERVAPMSMWMLSTDVDLVSYDVRITIEKSILEAWVVDPVSDDMDSQVLHVPLPLHRGRPSLDAALTDPVLAARLGTGLAGPPPQLEWLFGKDPMAGLFRGDHQFQFIADQRIDNHLCRCVRVTVPENETQTEYRFYVDPENGLVRQVDLPVIQLPDSQGKPKQASISIELSSASFVAPSKRRVRNGFPKSPQRVKQFVPVPLPPPSKASDVPAELRKPWQEQVKQYQAALDNVRL